MIEFIRINDYVIKYTEIVYVERKGMVITIHTKRGEDITTFSVKYDSDYEIRCEMDLLAANMNAYELDYSVLTSSIIKQSDNILTEIYHLMNILGEIKSDIKFLSNPKEKKGKSK